MCAATSRARPAGCAAPERRPRTLPAPSIATSRSPASRNRAATYAARSCSSKLGAGIAASARISATSASASASSRAWSAAGAGPAGSVRPAATLVAPRLVEAEHPGDVFERLPDDLVGLQLPAGFADVADLAELRQVPFHARQAFPQVEHTLVDRLVGQRAAELLQRLALDAPRHTIHLRRFEPRINYDAPALLERFAEHRLKRLDDLLAHAVDPSAPAGGSAGPTAP